MMLMMTTVMFGIPFAGDTIYYDRHVPNQSSMAMLMGMLRQMTPMIMPPVTANCTGLVDRIIFSSSSLDHVYVVNDRRIAMMGRRRVR
jgi:hypothetical protein